MKYFKLLLFLLFCATTAFAKTDKPNIVFILVDDLGYSDVGFNGSKYYETPQIDKLADESLILDNSYMYPTCSPSRTALFTGKQSFRTGVYTVPVLEKGDDQDNIFSRWTVGREHPIYAEMMADEGYKSIHLGKWHIVGPNPEEELNADWPIKKKLGQPAPGDYSWVKKHKTPAIEKYYPTGRGFIKNVGGTYRGDPALEVGGYKSATGGYHAPFSNPFIQEKEHGENWLTDRLTADAIDFMDEHKAEPFFVNLHYYTVHRPIRKRSEELYEKYIAKEGDPVTGQGLGSKVRREKMAAYATMIESLDDNVKDILDFLEKNNLRENTLIVFTSDNGYHGGVSADATVRGAKGHIYEGGIKVPTFINWPGKVKARRSDMPVCVLDYFPTLLNVSGVKKYKGKYDGKSLTHIFKKDCRKFAKRPLFWHIASNYHTDACSVIRKKEFKLIQFLKDGRLELYNLEEDPKEANNLVASNTKLAEQMKAELEEWRKDNDVPLPPSSVLKY